MAKCKSCPTKSSPPKSKAKSSGAYSSKRKGVQEERGMGGEGKWRERKSHELLNLEEQQEEQEQEEEEEELSPRRKGTRKCVKREDLECCFLGDPIPMHEATQRWNHRYIEKDAGGSRKQKSSDEEDEYIPAKYHNLTAEVDGNKIFQLNDHAHGQIPIFAKF